MIGVVRASPGAEAFPHIHLARPPRKKPDPFVREDLRHGFGNHHAFSYRDAEPTVNRRVVNDSIETVRFLSSAEFLDSLAPELR